MTVTMTTPQGMLAPCPFCGTVRLDQITVSDESPLGTHEIIRCLGCYAEAPIDRWNTRQAAAQGREALRRAIAEINVDDDGHSEGNLQYALIRGFSAMGWAQPTVASNDAIDAIVALALTPAVADGAGVTSLRALVKELFDFTTPVNDAEKFLSLPAMMAETGWWKRVEAALAQAQEPGEGQAMNGVYTDQPIFDAIAAATTIETDRDDCTFININVPKFIRTFNNHRDRGLCMSLVSPRLDSGKDSDQIALDAARQIEALPGDLHKTQKTGRIQLIILAAMNASSRVEDATEGYNPVDDRMQFPRKKPDAS